MSGMNRVVGVFRAVANFLDEGPRILLKTTMRTWKMKSPESFTTPQVQCCVGLLW